MEPNLSTENLLQIIGMLTVEKIEAQRLLSQQFSMLTNANKEISKYKEELALLYKQLSELKQNPIT